MTVEGGDVATTELALGTRVQVTNSPFWPGDPAGRLAAAPAPVVDLGGGWQGHFRWVPERSGLRRYYWVHFDTPQIDSDGDGPYSAGEVEEYALFVIAD